MNSIADWLSFEGEEHLEHGARKPVLNPITYDYPPSDVVSHRVLSSFPQLVPAGFKILHLPKDVISFACQAVQILKLSLMQKLRQEANHTAGCGENGVASAKTLLPEKIPCLMEYQEKDPIRSYGFWKDSRYLRALLSSHKRYTCHHTNHGGTIIHHNFLLIWDLTII